MPMRSFIMRPIPTPSRPALLRRSVSRAALCALLAAPGSAAAQEAAQVWTQAQPQEEVLVLEDILLQGSSYETEQAKSYTTDLLSVGDKDTRYPREIPQSTTVLTRQRLQDGNFTALDSAMRKTPGVMPLVNDEGRSSVYSRGFEFDTFSLNGLPTPLSSLYGTQPDMVVFDHVEILRGPSGLFTGSGEPAGAINMRLKQPTDDFQLRFSAIGGSWNNRRVEGDVGGPLNAAGTIRGRLVGAWGDRDSWMDKSDNQVAVGYGVIQADLTPDTTATFSLHHRERDLTPTNGLPTLAGGVLLDAPISTFVGADWNSFENKATDAVVELEHRFESGGHAKISGLYTAADALMDYAFTASAASPTGAVTGMSRVMRDYDQRSLALDAHVSKPFDAFGLEQNLIFGADYRSNDTTIFNRSGPIAGSANNIFDPTPVPRPDVPYADRTDAESKQYGVYGQWRVKPVQDLTAIVGGRLSWYEGESAVETLATGAVSSADDKLSAEFTPYAGLIWDFSDDVSAYASYTEIFQPQEPVGGQSLPPRKGRQYELGLKAELFDNVNASLAYFNIHDKDRAVRDPNDLTSTAVYPGGEATLQGVEIEAAGAITPNLEILAGYTYTDSAYEGGERPTGNRLEYYAPRHMLQLWGKYSFDESHGWLDGAHVGAGVKAFSDYTSLVRLANGSSTKVHAPGYVVLDLTAGYRINDNWDVSLTVNNALDKKYYERVHNFTTFNFYGEPRSLQLRLNAEF